VKLALLRSKRHRKASAVGEGLGLQVIEEGGSKGDEAALFRGYRSSHVARHLTAVDWREFAAITPDELLLKGWQGKDRHTAAPHLSALADRFDAVSFWVATQILVPESPQLQIKVLASFIKIMKRLVDMHNHQTASQILAALNMAAVQRLKKVWAGLSFKLQETFDEIDELFSPAGNYARYRELLRGLEERRSEPVLPYVAVFLRDVVYVFDGNADTTADGEALNVEKLELLSQQVLRLKALQGLPFSFQLKRDLLLYVRNLKGALDEEMLYTISLQRQPPAAGSAALSMPEEEEGATLEEIVSEPMLCNAFRRFLTRRNVAESLAFYRDVQRYDAAAASVQRLGELYATYMGPEAPLPVPVPATVSSRLSTAVEARKAAEGGAALHQAQAHVAELLRAEHVADFVQDALYRESKVVQERMRSSSSSGARKASALLTSDDWERLLERSVRVKLENGATVLEAGSTCDSVFCLQHGKLQVLARSDQSSSKTVVTSVEKRGSIVGELNVLDIGPSESTIVAKGKAELSKVRVADLYDVFLEELDLGKRYYQFLGRQLAIVLGSAFSEVAKHRKRMDQRCPEAKEQVQREVAELGMPRHTLRARFSCRPTSEPMCFCTLSVYRSFVHVRATHFGVHTADRIKHSAIVDVSLEPSGKVFVLLLRSAARSWKLAFEEEEEAKQAYELVRGSAALTPEDGVSESEASGPDSSDASPLAMTVGDWRLLATNSDFVMALAADDMVMEQGQRYQMVCLVLEGRCRVEAAGASKDGAGTARTVAWLEQGDVFGEMSFLTGAPATASVAADCASKVCVVTYDKLEQLFRQEPALVLKLYHHLCKFVAFRIESIKEECGLLRRAIAGRTPRGKPSRKEKREEKREEKRASRRR